MRTATILGATVALSLGLAAPAQASSQVADASTVNIQWADAGFGWATPTHYSFSGVSVSVSPRGRLLSVFQVGIDFDAHGNQTTSTIVVGSVESGFTATIDTARYEGASLDADAVPVQTCTYTGIDDLGTCVDGTTDVHVRWTGTGALTHEAVGGATRGDGSVTVGTSTSNSTTRAATATATISGLVDRLGDVEAASFGRATQARVFVCVPHLCPTG